MTQVFYFIGDRGHELFIYGHAEFDEMGKDIVCSAISSLGWALLGYLENCAHDESDYSYSTSSGRLAVSSISTPEIDAVFNMTVLGLRQIERKYPDYVRVSIVPHSADDSRE